LSESSFRFVDKSLGKFSRSSSTVKSVNTI
jgi:hypothetical protein